jgi:hypothetical protein
MLVLKQLFSFFKEPSIVAFVGKVRRAHHRVEHLKGVRVIYSCIHYINWIGSFLTTGIAYSASLIGMKKCFLTLTIGVVGLVLFLSH